MSKGRCYVSLWCRLPGWPSITILTQDVALVEFEFSFFIIFFVISFWQGFFFLQYPYTVGLSTWSLCLFRVKVCKVEIVRAKGTYITINSLPKPPSYRDFTKCMLGSCPNYRFPTSPDESELNLAIQFSKLFFRQPSTAKAKWEVKLASLADKFYGGT